METAKEKKQIEVERLSPEKIKELAREFFDKKWWVVTQDLANEQPMICIFLSAINAEYIIPNNVVLLAQHNIGARGFLNPPSYKWVHINDYNEAVKLLEKAKETLQ